MPTITLSITVDQLHLIGTALNSLAAEYPRYNADVDAIHDIMAVAAPAEYAHDALKAHGCTPVCSICGTAIGRGELTVESVMEDDDGTFTVSDHSSCYHGDKN